MYKAVRNAPPATLSNIMIATRKFSKTRRDRDAPSLQNWQGNARNRLAFIGPSHQNCEQRFLDVRHSRIHAHVHSDDSDKSCFCCGVYE